MRQAIETNGVKIVRVPAVMSVTIYDKHGSPHVGPNGLALEELEKMIRGGVRRIGPLTYIIW